MAEQPGAAAAAMSANTPSEFARGDRSDFQSDNQIDSSSLGTNRIEKKVNKKDSILISSNLDASKEQAGDPEPGSLHIASLFAPLPEYGPPTAARKVLYLFYKISSAILSLMFLGCIVLASMLASIPILCGKTVYTITRRNYAQKRIFYEEEQRRAQARKDNEQSWRLRNPSLIGSVDQEEGAAQRHRPTEGGRDPLTGDVAYYARRVGLDVEKIKVKTEDGFIIDLWHVFDPSEYTTAVQNASPRPRPFQQSRMRRKNPHAKRKMPVLLLHGLLQSSGAYCCNDDESMAFWLCKAGFDVWLGNNRCGLEPKHEVLRPNDPRMWCWNLNQMGVFDLSALIDRVLLDTGFSKVGLVCHSQGSAQTFVALAKEQRPELGDKISVFCALAPAVYAGLLIKSVYFRFIHLLSPSVFRIVFGVHAFIPLMMQMHRLLPPRLYGWLGYQVFSYLFGWTDARWDRGLRNRFFQFSPVYVSAEAMRWWLGDDGFAKHKCILATKETLYKEDAIDAQEARKHLDAIKVQKEEDHELRRLFVPGATAWYNEKAPPMALWICEADELVDGERLLRRFTNGREPHVKLVHSKTISGYEHLDVLWAINAVDEVFIEVCEVLWKTWAYREECITPDGCERVEQWKATA